MAKISHRLNKIESYFSNFSHIDSDKINIKSEIEKGALLYPSITFKYSDNGSEILTKIKKNLFLAYSEIEVQKTDKEEIENKIALSKIVSDFIKPYTTETIKKLQSQIDWSKNFKGSYLFYDKMLSNSFTSSYSGFFDTKTSVFKFCNQVDYNAFISSYKVTSTAIDLNGINLASGDDFITYRGSSRSSKVTVQFSIKTSSINYGCAIRSDNPMIIYSTKTSEYDVLGNSGNSSFTMTISGIYDGKVYNYDFSVSLSVFIESANEYSYETKEIPSNKLKNKIKIKKDFNDTLVDVNLKTILTSGTEKLEISKEVNLSKTENIVYELNESDDVQYEYVEKPIISDIRTIGMYTSAKYDNIKTDLTFNKPERVFLGLNCFKKTGNKESVINTIENIGSSTFLIKEMYSSTGVGTGMKQYDIPITITKKNSPFTLSQVQNENGDMVDCKQFSFFGKIINDNIYINEHKTTYRKANGVSTALSTNKYTTIYDSVTNMTTVVISANGNPEDITYSISMVSLLIKPANQTEYEGYYKIDNFSIYTDLFINNSNLFTTENPENSILNIANDDAGNLMLIKADKFTDVDLDSFFNTTEIKVVNVTYDVSLSKETFLDEYEAEVYMIDNDVFNVRLNDSDDNKKGYFYTLNGVKTDFISGAKDSVIVLRLYGSDAYVVKHTTGYDSTNYVVYCLGIMEHGNGEVNKKHFSTSVIRRYEGDEIVSDYYFQFYDSPFNYVAYDSNIICNPEVTSIPFMFEYKKIFDKNNLSFKLKLTTNYQGYPLNKLVMWSI